MVGIGPGDLSLLTFQARQALEEAEVIIGYTPYLSLIKPLLKGRESLSSGMMKEIERAQKAVEMALEGKKVAVISSGDPGVYGMAGLILEITPPESILVEVVPGVTAANAAAAVLGAPLMHDFTVISLSDLLTPWEVIEKRLEAAGAGDFISVLYNPASSKRRKHIERAREILLAYKDKSTPVGIVRNCFREKQEVTLTDLENMLEHTIDMFTTVVVGNSQTYRRGNCLITPRGYKIDNPEKS
ncbi:MAG: precorrin-3B C(17)-methyltransferase [Firmicutes bacterium HGW-Firmicutes-13]|nr:MAG: precorrin-3B C(17)-methyltransferase [Firmicutes bacterium HGW-Firmicutes-13]